MPVARPLRWGAVYAAAWTPLVLVYALLIGSANRMPVEDAIGAAAKTVSIAALLGLAVVWGTVRLNRSGRSAAAQVWRHAVGAVAYSAAWNATVLVDIRGTATWAETFAVVKAWIGWQVFFGAIIYGVIAGIVAAIAAVARGRAREAAVQQADALRARAELAALRGRLDPHFLFNTLHTVQALVRRDPTAAEQGVERLAQLLRYVLDHTGGARDEVPLDDELAFVDDYLALEALRLGDRLRVIREVDDDAREVTVPSLSLQPLVENAIRYGLSPKAAGGTLRVAAARLDDAVEIVIADDGNGASSDAGRTGYGLGLDSLRQRLAARYGAAASMDIVTAPGQGFRVTLRVPA